MRKDRAMDRHDRTSVIDLDTHGEDTTGHKPGTPPGSTVKSVQWDTDEPDELGTAEIKLLTVHSDFAPDGITIITVGLETSESSTYSVTYEIRDNPTDATPTTIKTIATSASEEVESSSLDEESVAAGQLVYVVLPVTDVNKASGFMNFTID